MAGRDINTTTTNIFNNPASKTFMATLRDRFEHERESSSEFHDVVEALKYYRDSIDQKPIRLETKLELGGRSSEINEALRAKELVVKLMTRYSLSEAAQLLIAFCLGRLRERFKAEVAPLINQGASSDAVNAALFKHVTCPVFDELGENFLNLMPQDLAGMICYLTANCFLQWHAEKENASLSSSA